MSGRASYRTPDFVGRPLAIAALAAFAVLGVAAGGWLASHHAFGYFTRDPAAITRQAPYMGMLSFFGLFAWAAGATALVCGGYVASLRGALVRRNVLFLMAAAVVYLFFDDAFQLHDYVYPTYLHAPDSVVQPAYVVVTLVAVVKGRRFLASTNFRLLATAGIFFAVSIAVDILAASERTIALEDGAKLIGIFVLTAYCVDTALEESHRTFDTLKSSGGDPMSG